MLEQLVFLCSELQNYPIDLSIKEKRFFAYVSSEITTSFWHITKKLAPNNSVFYYSKTATL